MDKLELVKKVDIGKIADEGTKIYEEIKSQYDPKEKGKFLAIEVESKDAFLGKSSADALEKAKDAHPNKVFFVLEIGFDTIEAAAKRMLMEYRGMAKMHL